MRPLVAVIVALFPVLGHAEVMDKEPALVEVLISGVLGMVAVFLAARFKPLALIIVVPLMGWFFAEHLFEVTDPHVGPAILAEAGWLYVVASWAAPLLALIGGALGSVLRRRRPLAN